MMTTIQLRDYVGAILAREEARKARARRRERIELRIAMAIAFAPGVAVFLGLAWGLAKWALGVE